jgi:hypothetical protein
MKILVVEGDHAGCTRLVFMASTKKTQTPSGHGVVDRGRQEPRANRQAMKASNGTGSKNTTSTPTSTKIPGNGKPWWAGIKDEPMRISAGLHRLADSIYSPQVGDIYDHRPSRSTATRSKSTAARSSTTSTAVPKAAVPKTSKTTRSSANAKARTPR